MKTNQILQLSAPYCRESKVQHRTGRVVGTPKYAPGGDGKFGHRLYQFYYTVMSHAHMYV